MTSDPDPDHVAQPDGSGGDGPRRRPGRATVLLAALGAVVLAAAVVGILFATGVFDSDDDDGPAGAARTFVEAAKQRDLAAAKASLCRADRTGGTFRLSAGDDIDSYTIGTTRRTDDTHARVRVSVTVEGKTDSLDVPVSKEGQTWKVCFSDLDSGDEVPGRIPTYSP